MVKYIQLINGGETIVSGEDFEWLNQYEWRKFPKGHVVTYIYDANKKRSKTTFMHRLIMSTPDDMFTDHIDQNPLNNERSNLRICTHGENVRNRPVKKTSKTGYKGVIFKKKSRKFQARITIDGGKRISLGYFYTAEAAHEAYKEAVKKYHGEFAFANRDEEIISKKLIKEKSLRSKSNSSSGYRGVRISKISKSNKFIAVFRGKYIGRYPTAELAAQAYNKRALESGMLNWLNMIPNQDNKIDLNISS